MAITLYSSDHRRILNALNKGPNGGTSTPTPRTLVHPIKWIIATLLYTALVSLVIFSPDPWIRAIAFTAHSMWMAAAVDLMKAKWTAK